MAKELTVTEQELLRLAAGLMDHLSSVTEAQTAALDEPKREEAQGAISRKMPSSRGGKAKKP